MPAVPAVQGVKYNIPVAIWLPERYPLAGPLAYVVPTPDMVIKPRHSFVDASGAALPLQGQRVAWCWPPHHCAGPAGGGLPSSACRGTAAACRVLVTDRRGCPGSCMQAWCTRPTSGSGATPLPTCERWPRRARCPALLQAGMAAVPGARRGGGAAGVGWVFFQCGSAAPVRCCCAVGWMHVWLGC